MYIYGTMKLHSTHWNYFTLIHMTFAADSKSFWEHNIPQTLPFWTERDKESRKRKEHMELPKLYWQEAGWENYSVANCTTFLEKEMETQSIKSRVQRVELILMENYSRLRKLIQGLPTFLSCISGLLMDNWCLCTSNFPPVWMGMSIAIFLCW